MASEAFKYVPPNQQRRPLPTLLSDCYSMVYLFPCPGSPDWPCCPSSHSCSESGRSAAAPPPASTPLGPQLRSADYVPRGPQLCYADSVPRGPQLCSADSVPRGPQLCSADSVPRGPQLRSADSVPRGP